MDAKQDQGLKLHTTMIPAQAAKPAEEEAPRVKWRVARHPKEARRLRARKPRIRQRKETVKKRATVSERLLRNTAIACAMLLTVMAMRNIDTPFTNRVTGAVNRVISMDLKLDESLGKLSFVQNLMPESALVFLNLTSRQEEALPVSGPVAHEWTREQPWLEYTAVNAEPVYAVQGGKVAACLESAQGDWTLLVNHADGSQAVYAYLAGACVRAGDEIARGAQIGEAGVDAGARLYLEYRVDSAPADPAALFEKADA